MRIFPTDGEKDEGYHEVVHVSTKEWHIFAGDEMADAPIKTSETAIARNEIALSLLRESALEALIKGRASVSESTAVAAAGGRKIETIDKETQEKHTITIDGKAVGARRTFGNEVKGDFSIVRVSPKGADEKAEFELTTSDFDDFWGRSDKFRVSMKRTKAAGGKAVESYEPAVSEKIEGKLDPNGQPLRTARPAADSEVNCQRENIDNRGNKRLLREYIIHNDKLGDLSYNETVEKFPAHFYHRSVIRDMKEPGKVLGIVEQSFKIDDNGDLTSVTTKARRPAKLKK